MGQKMSPYFVKSVYDTVTVLVCSGCHNKIPQSRWCEQKFPHSSGRWKSKIKVPAGFVSGEASFSSMQETFTGKLFLRNYLLRAGNAIDPIENVQSSFDGCSF